MKNYKEQAERYAIEAEAFSIFYEDQLNYTRVFMVFAGILTLMYSDLAVYEKKYGEEKSQKQRERLSALNSIYTDLNGISEQNLRLRLQLQNSIARQETLEDENNRLKVQLNAVEKAWQET